MQRTLYKIVRETRRWTSNTEGVGTDVKRSSATAMYEGLITWARVLRRSYVLFTPSLYRVSRDGSYCEQSDLLILERDDKQKDSKKKRATWIRSCENRKKKKNSALFANPRDSQRLFYTQSFH